MSDIKTVELIKVGNYKLLDLIRKGNSGSAYHTECGKVIKLTKDKSEFENSLKVMGKKHPNIVYIFDVFEYKEGYYAIVSELLDIEKYKKVTYELFEHIEEFHNISSDIKYIDPSEIDLSSNHLDIFKQVVSGIHKLESLGVYCYDVAESNVGFRGEEIVLFDLESESD